MNETYFWERRIHCMNETCEAYQKIRSGHVIKVGQTQKCIHRYRFTTCRKTCAETKGTLFYRLRHSEENVVECMALLSDRNRFAAIHWIKGIKEETMCHWMEKMEGHREQLEEQMILPYTPTYIQIDARWSLSVTKKKRKREEATKGIFWRITAIDGENRLRLRWDFAKTEAKAAYHVVKHMPQEPHTRATDGLGAYREAMIANLGYRSRISRSWKTASTLATRQKLDISTDHREKRKGEVSWSFFKSDRWRCGRSGIDSWRTDSICGKNTCDITPDDENTPRRKRTSDNTSPLAITESSHGSWSHRPRLDSQRDADSRACSAVCQHVRGRLSSFVS